MLSSVSKLADKAFVIGFLLPALMFCVVVGVAFPCPTWLDSQCKVLRSDQPFANLTYFALIVWIVAVCLLGLSGIIYRFYEGYLWPWRWLRLPLWIQKQRRTNLEKERDRHTVEGRSRDANRVKRVLLVEFPEEPHMLPTMFGNRLRAFEVYSRKIYGADAIPLWSRLSTVVPASFKTEIEDARAPVNFLMNVSMLSWIVVLCLLVYLVNEIAAKHGWPTDGSQRVWGLIASVAVGLIAYYWAVAVIPQWGVAVKAAFDCYLPALAKQLGYELPPTETERAKFWKQFTKLFLYNRQIKDGRWKWIGSTVGDSTEGRTKSDGGEAEKAAGDSSDEGGDDDDEAD